MTITDLKSPDDVFKSFVQADSWKNVHQDFNSLCESLSLEPGSADFYSKVKAGLRCNDALTIFKALDKRANQREYDKGIACKGKKVSSWHENLIFT